MQFEVTGDGARLPGVRALLVRYIANMQILVLSALLSKRGYYHAGRALRLFMGDSKFGARVIGQLV